MNAKTKLGIGMLFLIMACMIVSPVSADSVIVQSGLAPSFSMTVNPGNLWFNLTTVGTNEKTDGSTIAVNTNGAYAVNIKSDKAGGKMQRFDGSQLQQTFLANPLEAKLNGGSFVSLTTTDQILHSGLAGTFSAPLNLRQVTVFADAPAQGSANYQCTLTITGGNVIV